MMFLIIIAVGFFILERIVFYIRGPHLIRERINQTDYRTIHRNDSKIIVNNHYHDNRKFTYNDNRSYHYEDNSKHEIDNSQHHDNRKYLNIENLHQDFSRNLTQSFDFSKSLSLTSIEENILSPKRIVQLEKPLIPVFQFNEKKQLKP